MMPNVRAALLSPQGIPRNGLVGWWKFNDGSGQTLKDYSVKGNHGTLGADSGASTDDPTWTSQGLSFDGGDYVNLGNPTDFQVGLNLTIAVVLKPAAGTGGPLICKNNATSDGPGNRGFYVSLTTTPGVGGFFYDAAGNRQYASLPAVTAGAWNVVFTGVGGGTVFNLAGPGLIGATKTITQPYAPNTGNNLYIGRYANAASYLENNNAIGYIAAWNRKLTRVEMKQAYKVVKHELASRGVTLP